MNSSAADTPFAPSAPSPARPVGRADAALEWIGERLNPILVKEARQALKSRQFVVTFGLLLIAAWAWSLIGLVVMGADVAFGQAGPGMFMGYYVILVASLGIFVPFGAFRSLAAEQEDRTYELLSITDLSPRQIISGKLGSAVVQMLIYLSAIAPCLAFTYMLRGLALPMILFVVAYTVLGSLGLSVVGLLAGTLTGEKHWQVLLSVALIVGLLIVFWMACLGTGELIFNAGLDFTESWFWIGTAAWVTAYLTYFALAFFAAVSQITFASDNRSTRLRVVMVVQHACCIGWFGWLMITEEFEEEFLFVLLTMLSFHWYFMGSLMTGEWPELSMRVKRRLPQSFLGRVFLTWLNPGPGTGYMLTCCGMIAAGFTALTIMAMGMMQGFGGRFGSAGTEQVTAFAVLAPGYVISYLGVGLLLMRLLRRITQPTIFLAALIQVLLLLVGIAGPFVLESIFTQDPFRYYSLIQITNPFWSILHVVNGSVFPPEAPLLLALVPSMALIIFLLNLPGILHEVRQVRIAKPQRVAEEDLQIAEEKAPRQPVQISPWDTV